MEKYLIQWAYGDGIIGFTDAASPEEALEKARLYENKTWKTNGYSKEKFAESAFAVKVSDLDSF